jgi:hypothetical protein
MGRLNRADKKLKPAQTPSASTHTFNVADLITPAEAIPVTSFVDRASGDGRSIVHHAVRVNPPSSLKRAHLGEYSTPLTEAGPPNSADVQDDRYTMAQGDNDYDDPPVQPLPRLPNPKRLEPSVSVSARLVLRVGEAEHPQDKSMNRWMRTLCNIFLVQLLRRNGCADSTLDLCLGCGDVSRPARYRCQDCAGGVLLCKASVVDKHVELPLHVIYVSFASLDCETALTAQISGMEWDFFYKKFAEGRWAAHSIRPPSAGEMRPSPAWARRLCGPS